MVVFLVLLSEELVWGTMMGYNISCRNKVLYIPLLARAIPAAGQPRSNHHRLPDSRMLRSVSFHIVKGVTFRRGHGMQIAP